MTASTLLAYRPGASCRRSIARIILPVLLIIGAAALELSITTATAAEGLFERDRLTGDWAGIRKQWEDSGVELGATDIAEMLANPIGGVRQLTIYDGQINFFLNLDLKKIADWPGATFHANAYQINGRGLSRTAVGNLLAVSNIEALPSIRLFDLWLQQALLDGALSIRAGQIAADDEFFISQYATSFINATFGWPEIMSANLPSGGPAYPLATPGARFRIAPTTALTLSAAAFNGNPAPPGPGDPQMRNPSGTNFLVGEGGVLLIAEAEYGFEIEPRLPAPPSSAKLGAWYHSGDFADQRFDTSGRSLADPGSSSLPARHRGDFGLYLTTDQMLWRRPNTLDGGLAAFLRLGGAPADRNLIGFYADAGLTYKGLFPACNGDILGLAASYAPIGHTARRLDRDAIFFTGIDRPVRSYEAVIELTYQAQIAPWLVVQPDLQLVVHPGGHVAIPTVASAQRAIPNGLILGVRTSVTF